MPFVKGSTPPHIRVTGNSTSKDSYKAADQYPNKDWSATVLLDYIVPAPPTVTDPIDPTTMYVTSSSSPNQAYTRPLPVEKSAGKVSSLVARWQTAANKAEESAARQRDSDSRRSSSVSQASASRRSSENYSVKPSPRIGSGTFEKAEEDGIEELKDLSIDDSKKVRGDDTSKLRGGRDAGKGDEKPEEIVAEKKTGAAAAPAKSVFQSTKSTPRSPTTKKSTSHVTIESPKVQKTTATASSSVTTPQSSKTSTAKGTTPSKIPTLDAAKQPSSASSVRTRTTSGSSRIPQAVKPQSITTTSDPKPALEKTKSTVPTAKPPISKIITPAKPLASVNTATPANAASVPRPSTAQKTPLSSTTKTTRPAPSSFSRGTASKLTPSHTGPLKRPSSTTPGSSSISPTPLRPQITGTPSKHTASSLAKAKEASEKRQSISLGKSSGQARPSFSGTKAGTEVPKSTPPSAARPTVPSSASRLMQGTASSRAKAAAAQPASPTRAKTVKSTTSTPVKGPASKIMTPVKSVKSANPQAAEKSSGTSKGSSESANEETPAPKEPEAVEQLTTQSVVPRTPSPRPRSVMHEDTEAGDEEPEEEQKNKHALNSVPVEEESEAAPEEIPRAAIIGRVGLAGAREAPGASEGLEGPSPTVLESESNESPTGNDNGDRIDKGIETEGGPPTTTENGDIPSTSQIHPDDIDDSGHIVDPETPRSGPSSGQDTNTTRNPFGRIGHPGAKAGTHDLEGPNSKTESTAQKRDETPKQTEWREEELRRDPAKTIVSPDAGKGAFAEQKE